eukprot:2848488-Amphidinium_carterae.1
MATSTTEAQKTQTRRALGAALNEGDNNNKADRHLRDKTHKSPSSESTIDADLREDSEIIMWNVLLSPRCSPIVKDLLHRSFMFPYFQEENRRISSTVLLKDQVIAIAMTLPMPLDNFTPVRAATDDHHKYLWFTWLTETQYMNFKNN